MGKEELFRFSEKRTEWLEASDDGLLKDCRFDAFKSTGKGGQKRNKTSSALRLIHSPSGISVTAENSRYQHENRSDALKKLRYAIAVEYRCPAPEQQPFQSIEMSLANRNYHIWVAYVLDLFYDSDFDLKTAAERCGLSPSKLVKLVYRDNLLWQELKRVMESIGLKTFRAPV